MNSTCPHCGTEYEIDESEYGRFVKCEVCGKGFVAGTSAAKKLGEVACAATDALKIAANTAYERVKNIDWKTRQERAKVAIGSTYEKGKGFWSSAKRAWRYAFKVQIEMFLNKTFFAEKPTIRQLLVSSPWTIQFATAYLVAFGVALVICNLLTSKFPTSVLSSLIILAITIGVEYSLVRVRAVSWLLFAWGLVNAILLVFGSQDFVCFWPFNVSFIAIAILLALPITQKWYKDGSSTNQVANLSSFKKISALAAIFAVVAGGALFFNFTSEQRRIHFLRGRGSVGMNNSQKAIREDNRRKIELYHSAIYKLDCGYRLTEEEAVVVRKVADLKYRNERALENLQKGKPLSADDSAAIGGWTQWKAAEDPSSCEKAMQDLYERETGFGHHEHPLLD